VSSTAEGPTREPGPRQSAINKCKLAVIWSSHGQTGGRLWGNGHKAEGIGPVGPVGPVTVTVTGSGRCPVGARGKLQLKLLHLNRTLSHTGQRTQDTESD